MTFYVILWEFQCDMLCASVGISVCPHVMCFCGNFSVTFYVILWEFQSDILCDSVGISV